VPTLNLDLVDLTKGATSYPLLPSVWEGTLRSEIILVYHMLFPSQRYSAKLELGVKEIVRSLGEVELRLGKGYRKVLVIESWRVDRGLVDYEQLCELSQDCNVSR
jgi:hypothetical protein